MSEKREETRAPMASTSLVIDELARLQHAQEVHGTEELAADIWESDEELDAFLADLPACRNASLG